jgi:hypothetical protein
MANPSRRALAAGALIAALALSACAAPAGPSPTPTEPPTEGAVVVTFRAPDGAIWRQRLTEPADIEIAREIAAGLRDPMIPNGRIVRNDPDVNEGWSWHLDPADFEWAEFTMEVCDGLPIFVEDGTLTSDRYCPWTAEIVSVEPLE